MKFSRIRDFRLILLVPCVLLTLAILLLAINRSRYYMEQQDQLVKDKIYKRKGRAVRSFIRQSQAELERFNYTFSKVPFVLEGFKDFQRYGNANKAGNLLKASIKEYLDAATEEVPYYFQFTLQANNIALFRSSDNSIGRILPAIEFASTEAIKTNTTISGFDFGKKTLYLKSAVIAHDGEKQHGAVETQLPVAYLIEEFKEEMGVNAAFYLDLENIPKTSASDLDYLAKAFNESRMLLPVGKSFSFISTDKLRKIISENKIKDVWISAFEDKYIEFNTIRSVNGDAIGYWVVVSDITDQAKLARRIIRLQNYVLPGIFICLTILLFVILTELITKPFKRLTTRLNLYLDGEYPEAQKREVSGELRQIHRLVDKLVDRTNAITEFARKIGTGELKTEYHSYSGQDKLGRALVEMRDRLVEADRKAKERADIERKERWVADGVAKLSDILRQYSNNVDQLNEAVVSFLVNYLDIIQGAVYTLEKGDDNQDYLKLSAAYSYQQKKYMNVKIKVGEGLVGTCAAEKEKIYLENVPEDHIRITSGLGEAKPAFIFLYPLVMNEQLFGVVELNDFKPVENFRFNFVEKVAESFAATLANVKINERTNLLLKQYQQQGKELAYQEEQMRQSLDQMLIGQEEALQKERTVSTLIESIDLSIIRIELSLEGMIINTNNYFLLLIEEITEGVVGRHFESFIEIQSRPEVQRAMSSMSSIKPYHCRVSLLNKFGKLIELVAVFSPIVDETDQLVRVHFLAQRA